MYHYLAFREYQHYLVFNPNEMKISNRKLVHTMKLRIARLLRASYSFMLPVILRVPGLRTLIKRVTANLPFLLELIAYSDQGIYEELKSTRGRPLVMIDVTHMAKTELNTGIQRVVRALLNEFKEVLPEEIDVEPIILTSRGGFWHYRYLKVNEETNPIVVPRQGDVFLGLDLNAQIIAAQKSGLFSDWKRRGAKIVFAVHDILPIIHPEWWGKEVSVNHEKWLASVLEISDVVLSVSQTTQRSVIDWCKQNDYPYQNIQFEWFHLGADFEGTNQTQGLPSGAHSIVGQLQSGLTFLNVGTIEPRKGHRQCLEAFDALWNKGLDVNLVFVGKQGWMVDSLIELIRNHPELNSRLFWLEGISDEFLDLTYKNADCFIAPSKGEGFGIPLIEAARHGLPIIARDIPIFREVAGSHAHYFDGEQANGLSEELEKWVAAYKMGDHVRSSGLQWQTWKDSAEKIKRVLSLS